MYFRGLLICLSLASRVAFGESCANGITCVCTSFNLTTPNCHCGDATGATCDPRLSSTSVYNPTNPNGTTFAQGCTASLPDHTATNESGEVDLPTGQKFSGSFHHYGGFDAMDLSSKTGCTSGCTAASSVPMLQATGGFMVMPALLTAQQRPTVLADASGQCPTASGIAVTNYIISAWAPGTTYVLDSKQVVMGESEIDYTNPSVTYVRNNKRLNLAGTNLGAGNGASYTCSNGTGFAAGTAGTTNQGTLMHSSDGGHANFTGDGQVILTMPQDLMPSDPAAAFTGTWSGFYYGTAAGTTSLTPFEMAWDAGTSRLVIYPLVDYTQGHSASGNSPSGNWLSLSVATNTPLTGAFNGTITKGAATSLYDCLYRNVTSYSKSIICVADSKAAYGNTSGAPMTIVAIAGGGASGAVAQAVFHEATTGGPACGFVTTAGSGNSTHDSLAFQIHDDVAPTIGHPVDHNKIDFVPGLPFTVLEDGLGTDRIVQLWANCQGTTNPPCMTGHTFFLSGCSHAWESSPYHKCVIDGPYIWPIRCTATPDFNTTGATVNCDASDPFTHLVADTVSFTIAASASSTPAPPPAPSPARPYAYFSIASSQPDPLTGAAFDVGVNGRIIVPYWRPGYKFELAKSDGFSGVTFLDTNNTASTAKADPITCDYTRPTSPSNPLGPAPIVGTYTATCTAGSVVFTMHFDWNWEAEVDDTLALSAKFTRYNLPPTTLHLIPSTYDSLGAWVPAFTASSPIPSDATATVSWSATGVFAGTFSGSAMGSCSLNGDSTGFDCVMPSLPGDGTTGITTVNFVVSITRASPPLSLTFRNTYVEFQYLPEVTPHIDTLTPDRAYYENTTRVDIRGSNFSMNSVVLNMLSLVDTPTNCVVESDTYIHCDFTRTGSTGGFDAFDGWYVSTPRQAPNFPLNSNFVNLLLPGPTEVLLTHDNPEPNGGCGDWPGPPVEGWWNPSTDIPVAVGSSDTFYLGLKYTDNAVVRLTQAIGLSILVAPLATDPHPVFDATQSGNVLTISGLGQGHGQLNLSIYDMGGPGGTQYGVKVGSGCPMGFIVGALYASYECTCEIQPPLVPMPMNTPYFPDPTTVWVPNGTAADHMGTDCAAKCSTMLDWTGGHSEANPTLMCI